VILSKNGRFLDVFLFSDQMRRGAVQAVARLAALGFRPKFFRATAKRRSADWRVISASRISCRE
jgi:ABC-type sugar transport system substrate-binding protein